MVARIERRRAARKRREDPSDLARVAGAKIRVRRATAVRDLLAQTHALSPDRLTVETAADAASDVVPELRAGGGE